MNLTDLISEGYSNISITVDLADLVKMVDYVLTVKDNRSLESSVDENDEYITRQDVMRQLDVKETTIFNWTRKGYLRPHKIGRKTYFLKSDVLALLTGKG